jgi:hypothetical protein
MRPAGGTKFGEPARVTSATNFSIVCLAAPSRQDGSVALELTVAGDDGAFVTPGVVQPAAPSATTSATRAAPNADPNVEPNAEPNAEPNVDRDANRDTGPNTGTPAARIDPAACSDHPGSQLERIQPPFRLHNSITRGDTRAGETAPARKGGAP